MKNKNIFKTIALALVFTFALTNIVFAGQFANIKMMPVKPKATFAKVMPGKLQITPTKPKTMPEKSKTAPAKAMPAQKTALPVKKGKEQIAEMKLPIWLNGREAKFDIPPVIKNGRTLIPLRAVMEKFGVQVAYDKATNTITEPPRESPTLSRVGMKVAINCAKEANCKTKTGRWIDYAKALLSWCSSYRRRQIGLFDVWCGR